MFKEKYVWDSWCAPENTGFQGTAYAATSNGWMETEVFQNYFQRTFLPAIGNERPVLPIYHGHSTHLGIELINLAQENGVHILKLPPHSSHLLQPLDLSVFKSLKTRWDMELTKWQRKNVGLNLPKCQFSRLIGDI